MHGKSNLTKQKNTKSMLEKNAEDEEIKKYEAIINKLSLVVTNKDRVLSQTDNEYSTKRTPSIGKNKSTLLRLTMSRTRDDRNDKDFLNGLMNNDIQPILPKNLHLLSDNDTNQSISNTEKFKNLSNLMISDKESFVEKYFIRNTEDRLILELYSTLSREAKEIFLEEENKEKLAKKRLLFHKINDIKIPKIDFNKNENESEIKKDNNNIIEEETEEKDEKNENECYFKQKEKGYFHIPKLIKFKEYQKKEKKQEKEQFNNETFWDPEIDADSLAYINHNIIRIEDIYNSEENNNEILDNNDEENIVPIELQEIKSSSSSDNEEEERNLFKQRFMRKSSNVIEEEEVIPKKNVVKFSDFCDIASNQIVVTYPVDPNKEKEYQLNAEIKDKYDHKLEKIYSYKINYFPKNSSSFSNDLIFRIATRNEKNKFEQNSRFIIRPTKKQFSDNNLRYIQKLRRDLKKKTVITTKIKSSFGLNSLRDSLYIHKKKLNKPPTNLS